MALHVAGLPVSVVHPRRISGYAASQLRRSKTDAADAALLARFCQRERPEPWATPGSGERHRRALYFPANSAMRHNEAVRVFAERLLGQGKTKMAVVGASMRKLVQICYGVLKSGQPFDASMHSAT